MATNPHQKAYIVRSKGAISSLFVGDMCHTLTSEVVSRVVYVVAHSSVGGNTKYVL